MAGSLAEIDRSSYPGLELASTDLWRAWLKYYERDFAGFDYNVRVGAGITPPANLDAKDRAVWKALTQLRIDVVAHRYDSDWIIEITDRVTLKTLGQILGYGHLAPKYIPLKPTVRLAVVCSRLGYDMGQVLTAHNVLAFFFPPHKTPVFPPGFEPSALAVPPAG